MTRLWTQLSDPQTWRDLLWAITDAAIAAKLVVTERAAAKHTSNIFAKLDLPPSDDDNRRVLALLAHLDR